MATPVPIDVRHLGTERVIGSYLVETDDGATLFDCGPTSTLETLKAELHERGIGLGDVGHLLLSHIHLDHAGAAGVIVREHPHVQVHVSGVGAPHLVDPARLETSARRLYGDAFDALWGELAPVPEANVHVVGERVLGLDCFPSPGHASHHVCYLDAEGTLFAGDAAGVRIAPQQVVLPPTPPPDVDVAAWDATLDEIARRAPPPPLGRARRGRRDAGGVRDRSQGREWRSGRGLHPGDAALAVLRGPETLGREGQAQPVTSQRRRLKRTISVVNRTQIRASNADQTPTIPQS